MSENKSTYICEFCRYTVGLPSHGHRRLRGTHLNILESDWILPWGGGILTLTPPVDFIADCCVLGMWNKLAQR